MKSRLIPYLVAIALAVAAAVGVLVYTSSAEQRALEAQGSTTVLISSALIPAGTTLGDAFNQGLISLEQYPVASVPTGIIPEITSENTGLLARTAIAAGQVLLVSNFASEIIDPAGLIIPAGKLAVAVEIGDAARVANFVRPGAEVALFLTLSVPDPEQPEDSGILISTTTLLLERLTVLAIGPVTQQNDLPEGQVPTSILVTFAATQLEAEKLIHARTVGSLYLALLDDNSEVAKSDGITNEKLFLD